MPKLRGLCVLILAGWSAGCSRQQSQQPAGTAATAQAAAPAAASKPDPAQPVVTIPAGTRIHVRPGTSLDTKFSRRGERFIACLDRPVTLGDRVVVPTGTRFDGHVTWAKRPGRLRGRAYLGVRLDSFRFRGATYRIATGADVRSSRSHKRQNLAIIGGGSGTGAMIGALAGGGVGAGAGAAAGTTGAFITGRKNVKLRAETPLVFSLHTAVTVRG